VLLGAPAEPLVAPGLLLGMLGLPTAAGGVATRVLGCVLNDSSMVRPAIVLTAARITRRMCLPFLDGGQNSKDS
jgi:hypothetical protein